MIKPFSEVPLGGTEIKEPELKLAIQLIDQIAADEFNPEAYEDTQRNQVRALIDRKIQGEEITAAPVEQPKAQIIDLMEALKASLAAAKPGAPAAEKPVSIADRKPAKRSVARPAAAADEAPKKKSSKR